MRNPPSIPDDEYVRRVNLVEDLVSFHPEYLDRLPTAQRTVLSRYYFAGRKVDVESVTAYRHRLLDDEPAIAHAAERAWEAFAKVAKLGN